jgi:hypothetical protein
MTPPGSVLGIKKDNTPNAIVKNYEQLETGELLM